MSSRHRSSGSPAPSDRPVDDGGEGGTTPRASGGVDGTALAAVLDDFAATVTGDFSVGDILRQLGTGVARVLDVDGAGVMTPRSPGGLLRVASATTGVAMISLGPFSCSYFTGLPSAAR